MPDYDDIDLHHDDTNDDHGWLLRGMWKTLLDIEEVLEDIRDNQGPPGHTKP